jgi:hypothetical protein
MERWYMQIDLNLEALTKLELTRLSHSLEALTESKRSRAFNRFLFWAAREVDREIRGRRLRIHLRHVANVEVDRMRPGELVFLRSQLRDWEVEFGQHAMGMLAELFWSASATLLQDSMRTMALN